MAVINWRNGPLVLVVFFLAMCLLLFEVSLVSLVVLAATWSAAGIAYRACHSSGTFFFIVTHAHTHTHTHTRTHTHCMKTRSQIRFRSLRVQVLKVVHWTLSAREEYWMHVECSKKAANELSINKIQKVFTLATFGQVQLVFRPFLSDASDSLRLCPPLQSIEG